MAGHYLTMDMYRIKDQIIDGLTGKIIYYNFIPDVTMTSSSLVIFNPLDTKCFSSSGDYDCEAFAKEHGYYYAKENRPRYAKWDGERFITICEPVIRGWKLISCGKQ